MAPVMQCVSTTVSYSVTPSDSSDFSPVSSPRMEQLTPNPPNSRISRSLSPRPSVSSTNSLARSASDRDREKARQAMSISVCPSLTPAQVLLIRKSWKHINTKAFSGVLRRCFQRLESSCPCVAASFAAASNSLSTCPASVRTLADHARYLSSLVQRLIESDEGIEDEIRNVGAGHVRLQGIGTKEFERFGEILVEVILKLDGIQQSKETGRAWRQLLCAMVDMLRDGFDSEMRQTRRKSSFGVHSEYFNGLEFRRASTPGSPRKSSLNLNTNGRMDGRKLSDY